VRLRCGQVTREITYEQVAGATQPGPEPPHQGTTPPSSWKPPVGPPSGSVANRTAMAAPSLGVLVPLNPVKSVAT